MQHTYCTTGYYSLHCNGNHLAPERKINPGNSNFQKRVYYLRHSLATCITPGRNALGVTLGNGWFSRGGLGPEATGLPGSRAFPPQALLRASFTLRMSNGTVAVVVVATDTESGSWQAAAGPVLYDSLYNGETYDATKELVDVHGNTFSEPSYEVPDGVWTRAVAGVALDTETVILKAQMFEPVQKLRKLGPSNITKVGSTYVVDFGQNSAAVVGVTIRGNRGQNITLLHAEVLQHPPYGAATGDVYQGNLRAAKARDTYIMKGGGGTEYYEPTFTQHGFRYVQIYGLKSRSELVDIAMHELRTAVADGGSVVTSSRLLNTIQEACSWTAKSNLMSIPTDCPQRNERRGWMGDAAIGAKINSYNHKMAAFYTAFADLMQDDQGADGSMPNWVPIFGLTYPGPGAPNWMTAYPTIIWTVYKFYGDERIVRRHWGSLKKYIAWYDGKFNATHGNFTADPFRRDAHGKLSPTQFPGDWCPPAKTPGQWWTPKLAHSIASKSLGELECGHIEAPFNSQSDFMDNTLSSAFAYLKDRQLVKEMGAAIGELVAGITPAMGHSFNRAYLGAGGQSYGSGFQTEQAMALHLDVVPSANLASVQNTFVHELTKSGYHSSSGILGLKFGYAALMKMGRADVALEQLLQTSYPSFGFEVQGKGNPEIATTIWELYDAWQEGGSMNSRNHVMFATPSVFLFEAVGGVVPVEASTTWRIYPQLVWHPSLNSAATAVTTPRGNLSTAWTVDRAQQITDAHRSISINRRLRLNASVPSGLRVSVVMSMGNSLDLKQPALGCTVHEDGALVFSNGTFVPVPGVLGGNVVPCGSAQQSCLEFNITCGTFAFDLQCAD